MSLRPCGALEQRLKDRGDPSIPGTISNCGIFIRTSLRGDGRDRDTEPGYSSQEKVTRKSIELENFRVGLRMQE